MFVRAFVYQGVNVAIGGAENRDLLAAKDGQGARAKRRKLVDRADVEPMSVYHGSTSSNDRERPDFSDVLVQFLLRACRALRPGRSEEHTSELQSLMRISYAVFCLKKKKTTKK